MFGCVRVRELRACPGARAHCGAEASLGPFRCAGVTSPQHYSQQRSDNKEATIDTSTSHPRGAASSVGVQDISHIFCCSSFGSQPTTSITTAEDFDEKHSNMARSSSENISKLLGTYCVGTAKLIIRSHSHSIKSSTSSSFCYESHSK